MLGRNAGQFLCPFCREEVHYGGSRIKGITVEIGGDTTKLQSALKGVNSEIKNTQSQLKDVEKLLKLDPGNTELLAQKQNCPLFIIDKIIHNKVVYRKLMHFHRMPRLPFN
jgi:hypothetical protein